jgi:hypothetical protein
MNDGEPPRDAPGGTGDRPADAASGPDMQSLARDWITVWQSEIAAVACDREVQETWQMLAGLWAGVASLMLQGLPRGQPDGYPPIRARPSATARPPPAAAASDSRDAEVERLARRVAELERRLAERDRRD